MRQREGTFIYDDEAFVSQHVGVSFETREQVVLASGAIYIG